jgi:hypothetical protein
MGKGMIPGKDYIRAVVLRNGMKTAGVLYIGGIVPVRKDNTFRVSCCSGCIADIGKIVFLDTPETLLKILTIGREVGFSVFADI